MMLLVMVVIFLLKQHSHAGLDAFMLLQRSLIFVWLYVSLYKHLCAPVTIFMMWTGLQSSDNTAVVKPVQFLLAGKL